MTQTRLIPTAAAGAHPSDPLRTLGSSMPPVRRIPTASTPAPTRAAPNAASLGTRPGATA